VKRVAILAAVLCISTAALSARQQTQQPPTQQPPTQQPPAEPPAGQGPARGQSPPTGGVVATGPGRGRPTPPQPQQKQGPEYLVGTWDFTWTGRESPVTTGPRAGTVTFTSKSPTVLEVRAEGKDESGAAFKETGTAEWNDAQKTLRFKERVANNVELTGVGNWSSPLAIRYESEPARAGKQTVRIRRTYSILSATSFTVAEELSIDGGPYQRLGNGAYSRK
jgi:hypothetical protein